MDRDKRPAKPTQPGKLADIRENIEVEHSALRMVPGAERPGCENSIAENARRAALTALQYVDGVLSGDRTMLARAITLIESNAPDHFEQAQEVVQALLPRRGPSVRDGITGLPGAGKSTLVEALGMHLVGRGLRVAVTAVDPSSTVSGGSVLGDKTRMEQLSTHPGAFVRPSPTGGTLGGVTRKTRETILLFEAAGYDVVLVETVGVGQSETMVRGMVDFFLLVLIAGGGDELQGIKKGTIELADAIVINKADGPNRQAAELARAEYARALHYLRPATEGWQTRALTASALTGEGVLQMWRAVETFMDRARASGVLDARRSRQERQWMRQLLREQLEARFLEDDAVKQHLPELETAVERGEMSAVAAARRLLDVFRNRSA